MVRVVLTDHPWADVDVERSIIEGAGHELIVGPMEAADMSFIDEIVERANPEAILTCWARVGAKAVSAPDRLAIVARIGVGLDNIDVQAATDRGAWVTNVPDYCIDEVSDHAIALMLGGVRGIVSLDRAVKAKGWHVPEYVPPRVSELTVGVLGYGRIGRATARKLRALGCAVLAYDPGGPSLSDGVMPATLEEVQARADVIILHMPLLPATQGIVGRDFISACAKRPLIINVSRGGLIDNDALLWGLDQGLLRGAGLDVVDGEPAPPKELLERPEIVITPHIAYSSDASLLELRRRACEEVVRVLAGEPPEQPCNKPVASASGSELPGGVSSDIRIVEGADGPQVVKTALDKLKVEADWFSDPARSMVEVRALSFARRLLGEGAVPEVLWSRPDEHSFAMSLVDTRYRNWKQELLAGHVDQETARAVGKLLGTLHGSSAAIVEVAADFDDRSYFHDLRIEPFFERVAAKMPSIAAEIRSIADGIWNRRSALVHGDFSPKNILADGSEVVLLDWEVAHWGDPRFDLGFCLSHLILKALRGTADRQVLLEAARNVLDGYEEAAARAIEDADLARVTACLMLARTDGASPVDYLDEAATERVRRTARTILENPGEGIRGHISALGEVTA